MSSLEKINPFLRTALFNNPAVFLRCVYQEKGERSRVKLFISPLLQTAPNLGSETQVNNSETSPWGSQESVCHWAEWSHSLWCALSRLVAFGRNHKTGMQPVSVSNISQSAARKIKPSPVDISVWPRWCRQHPWCLQFRPHRNLPWSQRLNLGHWACACFQFSTAYSDAQTAHSRQYQVLV